MLIQASPEGCRPRNNGETDEAVGCSYTAIFGSHRNSCFKLERDGLTCCRVRKHAACAHTQVASLLHGELATYCTLKSCCLATDI